MKTAANLTPNIEQNVEVGGADRDRTGDPLLAKQVLSQLSYSPPKVVGLDRLELSTSPLSGVRSSHLSYRPGAIHLKMNSRTGLNVRIGYADPDHRAEAHEKRESKRGSLPSLR